MLKVQELMKADPGWRSTLSMAPYFISISEMEKFGRNLVLLKYNQIASDFNEPIVRECRGLILDADTYEVVCFPFTKFFNFGEKFADEIDWSTAVVSEKLDGSIQKVVNMGNGNFLISTNGTIDAFQCQLPTMAVKRPCDGFFGDLFLLAMQQAYGIKYEDFPKFFEEGFTYMFELTSPYNPVVVQWDEPKAWLIGIRDNRTFKEIRFQDHPLSKVFDTPHLYPITSIDECVEAAKALPENNEGYVVCDAEFRRVKVKSPRYVQLHYMANNNVWSEERILEIIRAGEVGEYACYFPLFRLAYEEVNSRYEQFVSDASSLMAEIDGKMAEFSNTKDFALWVMGDSGRKRLQGFAFKYWNHKVGSAKEWIDSLPNSSIVKLIGD